ncbi:hypothetical protein BaRGS_00000177, partial [Batillaria attramentaria]
PGLLSAGCCGDVDVGNGCNKSWSKLTAREKCNRTAGLGWGRGYNDLIDSGYHAYTVICRVCECTKAGVRAMGMGADMRRTKWLMRCGSSVTVDDGGFLVSARISYAAWFRIKDDHDEKLAASSEDSP